MPANVDCVAMEKAYWKFWSHYLGVDNRMLSGANLGSSAKGCVCVGMFSLGLAECCSYDADEQQKYMWVLVIG